METLKRVAEITVESACVEELSDDVANSVKGGKSCSCSCSCPNDDTDGGKSGTTLNTFVS
jgi:hypothetical protein